MLHDMVEGQLGVAKRGQVYNFSSRDITAGDVAVVLVVSMGACRTGGGRDGNFSLAAIAGFEPRARPSNLSTTRRLSPDRRLGQLFKDPSDGQWAQ